MGRVGLFICPVTQAPQRIQVRLLVCVRVSQKVGFHWVSFLEFYGQAFWTSIGWH